MQPISTISIVGAGNVAFHLAKAFHREGIHVDFIWNRTPEKAGDMAQLTGAKVTERLKDLEGSELIICAVSDDVLPELIPQLAEIAPVAATAGTTDILKFPHQQPIGVFYPLQTFSRQKEVDIASVPFFIEGSVPKFATQLKDLARCISRTVVELPWEKRVQLHLAAVFVNNFTNHLAGLAQEHLEREQLPFDWLKPLLRETVAKLENQTAQEAQTGPARRNDTQTIQQHLSMLSEEEAAVYRLLSEGIRKRFHKP